MFTQGGVCEFLIHFCIACVACMVTAVGDDGAEDAAHDQCAQPVFTVHAAVVVTVIRRRRRCGVLVLRFRVVLMHRPAMYRSAFVHFRMAVVGWPAVMNGAALMNYRPAVMNGAALMCHRLAVVV